MQWMKACLLSTLTASCLAFADPASNIQPVNINTANVEQLAALKGIGELKAQAIVAYRDHHGKFTSPEELTKVKGIGEATLASNRQLLVAE